MTDLTRIRPSTSSSKSVSPVDRFSGRFVLGPDQRAHIHSLAVDSVAYLHRNGVCHRDIKDENIVIDDKLSVSVISDDDDTQESPC